MKERIEIFKDELKHLHGYQNEIKRIDSQIELLVYDMENVKGLDYSKEKGNSFNEAAMNYKKLLMIDKLENLEKQKNRVEEKINSIYDVLDLMEEKEKELIVEVIAERKKYREVCKERNINNTSSLFAKINNIIATALKKMG